MSESLFSVLRSPGIDVPPAEYSGVVRETSGAKVLDPLPLGLRSSLADPPLGLADVAISFEEAEHLPATGADDFVQLLAATAPIVVMGASAPGQDGRGRRTDQPRDYWIAKFVGLSVAWDRPHLLALLDSWSAGGVGFWYLDNVSMFQRANSLPWHSLRQLSC